MYHTFLSASVRFGSLHLDYKMTFEGLMHTQTMISMHNYIY